MAGLPQQMPIRVAVMRAMVIPSTVMLEPLVSTVVQPVMLQAGMRMMLSRTVVTAMETRTVMASAVMTEAVMSVPAEVMLASEAAMMTETMSETMVRAATTEAVISPETMTP